MHAFKLAHIRKQRFEINKTDLDYANIEVIPGNHVCQRLSPGETEGRSPTV